MRYLSLFSGIEAASVAWRDLGWEPVAFCEIEEFPSAVLSYRFPNVPNLGDITKVDWGEFNKQHGTVDLIVGGSPCQSFSVAAGANRTSLDGKSNLMFEYLRTINDVRPKWIVWENVPGVLNTKDDAFGQLLGTLQEIGYRDIAYRVLDAQFFGVAQRRRRVFVVGRFAEFGFGAAAVLFDSESVQGSTTTNARKRAQLTGFLGRGSKKTICISNDTTNSAVDIDLCGTLMTSSSSRTLVTVPNRIVEDCAGTLTAHYKQGLCGDDLTVGLYVLEREPYAMKVRCGSETYTKEDGSTGTAGKGALIGKNVAFTLSATQDQTVFVNNIDEYWLRRLMPIECERLQGFPDDFTRIPYRGKPASQCPDTPRYKACGNSMAVPVMKWIGQRIQMVEEILEKIS